MNVLNIKFFISPSNVSIPRNLPTCMTWSLSKLYVIFDLHLLSLLFAHQLADSLRLRNYQSFFSLYIYTHHLTSGINFLAHFVSRVLICLFLIHLFSKIISPHQCHHHHSYYPSPHHSVSSIFKLKTFLFQLHRHLAPLRTDFTDTRTALQFFLCFSFFSSFQL